MADKPATPLKDALVDLIGMPVEAVLAKNPNLHKAEADMIRSLTPEDITNMRRGDALISKTLSESGGSNSCGCYY